ncbi:MAG TPA: PAS domain S-box protein, partial [Chitinophagaceae bacterium]|nr:PAS domain S-box protein [Chitinophagaceae bacterium]
MRIQKRILIVFGIALITTACFFYITYNNHKQIVENSSQLVNTQKILTGINRTFYTISDLDSNIKNFIITGVPDFESESINEIEELKKVSEELNSLTKTNSDENLIVPALIQHLNQKIDMEIEILQAGKISKKKGLEIIYSKKDRFLSDSLRQSLNKFQDIYSQHFYTQLAENKSISKSNLNSSIIVGLLALGLISTILLLVNRYMRLKKLAEKQAELKEIKYSKFVEDSGLVLLITDLSGNILFANKRVKFFTGLEPDEITGKHFSFLVDEEWIPVINSNFKKQLRTREFESHIEFPLKVKSDNPMWVEQSSIIVMENGRPTGFHCI